MHQKQNKRNNYKLSLLKIENSQLPIDPWGGEMIKNDGKVIGLATSGARGHTTNQSLVFAQLDSSFSSIGTRVQINLFDKHYDAEVIEPPKGQGFPAIV
jgi:glycine cleavage system aminomethyltransferase T